MSHFRPKVTIYRGTKFRSRIEARWACFFDTLEVEWVYELQHYDFGVKAVWDDDEFREYLNEALYENDWDDREDVIRDAYRHRYARRMYLPDFWLPEFNHWVEIKGKAPTYEEQMKASHLARKSGKPVTILWGHIFPDPHQPNAIWGDCTEVFGENWNIIAVLALTYRIANMDRAFAAARSLRFEKE